MFKPNKALLVALLAIPAVLPLSGAGVSSQAAPSVGVPEVKSLPPAPVMVTEKRIRILPPLPQKMTFEEAAARLPEAREQLFREQTIIEEGRETDASLREFLATQKNIPADARKGIEENLKQNNKARGVRLQRAQDARDDVIRLVAIMNAPENESKRVARGFTASVTTLESAAAGADASKAYISVEKNGGFVPGAEVIVKQTVPGQKPVVERVRTTDQGEAIVSLQGSKSGKAKVEITAVDPTTGALAKDSQTLLLMANDEKGSASE